MKNKNKTKDELINELNELRKQNSEFKRLAATYERLKSQYSEKENHYIQTTETGRVGIWDWNLKTDDMYVDRQLNALMGHKDQEINN